MKRRINKKGITLVEIVIVLAVVAIMSTMVVSFSLACNLWVQQGVNRQNMLSSFNSVKYALHANAGAFDDEDHIFSVQGARLCVDDVNAPMEQPYYLEFSEGALEGTSLSGQVLYPVDNITGIGFSLIKNQQEDALLICSVAYSIPAVSPDRAPETGTYTVAVALRVAAAEV